MLTMAVVRAQGDDMGDKYSDDAGIDTGDVLITRQEYKDEADLNILLARFGVDTQSRIPQYGMEVDYNLDLQQALSAIESARRANLRVPEELRKKYPDWRAVLNGAESGQYQKDLQLLADDKAKQQAEAEAALDLDKTKTAIKNRQKAERDLEREREDQHPHPKQTPKQ